MEYHDYSRFAPTPSNSNLRKFIERWGWIIFIVVLVVILIWILWRKREYLKNPKHSLENSSGSCSSCEISYNRAIDEREARKGLLPIMDPGFNLREVAKQMILLEDHLFNSRKRCSDCIRKHTITIEGLAEEAITLDRERKYENLTNGLPEEIRKIQKFWIEGGDPIEVAQRVRVLRKTLMNSCYDKFTV